MMERLKARLAAISSACEAAGTKAVSETAAAAKAEAAALAPVRTGRLRASIAAESHGLSGAVCADCEYAPLVELGGRGNPARPFLYPAAQSQVQAFPERAARAFSETLKGGN